MNYLNYARKKWSFGYRYSLKCREGNLQGEKFFASLIPLLLHSQLWCDHALLIRCRASPEKDEQDRSITQGFKNWLMKNTNEKKP